MTRGAALDIHGTLIRNDPVLAIPRSPTPRDLDLAALVRELAPMADIPFREVVEDVRETRYYPVGTTVKILYYTKEEDIRDYFNRQINAPGSNS
jgi:hypothetical protein